MISYKFTEKYEVNFRNMNGKRKPRISRNLSRNSGMSTKTKDFIQKICYKKTASIDMTQHGFINDSKLHPANLLLRPLRAQLEKICGKPSRKSLVRSNSPDLKKVTLNLEESAASPRSPRQGISPSSRGSPQTPTSAASSPGSRSPRRHTRKVTVTKPPSPPNAGNKKRVTLMSPTNKVKKY